MESRRRLTTTAALVLILAVLAPAAGLAQTEMTGQTSGGAYYRIVVPDGWTPANGLAIWNHSYDFAAAVAPLTDADMGPLYQVQLLEGDAVAASSYSLTQWAVFETVADNREMVQAFEAAFGVPDHVLIVGASLGGDFTARAIEAGGLGNVVGALTACGAVGSHKFWDDISDLRLIYDAVCGDVPGADIPGGATGLPFPPPPEVGTTTEEAVAYLTARIYACTGIPVPGLPPATPEQLARHAKILEVAGLPPTLSAPTDGLSGFVTFPTVLFNMLSSTFGIFDLTYQPRKLNGGLAFDNATVDYGDAEINANIERITADLEAHQRLINMINNYTPTGKVGDVKIVSIHTDKDGLMLIENESYYSSVVPEANLAEGIVVEDESSHCGFSAAESVAAWEALRAWVAGLPKPSAADMQAICEMIVAGGMLPDPGACRFDPGFVLPALPSRYLPCDTCVPGPSTLCLGDGRFRAEITWEDFMGNTGVGKRAAFQTPDSGTFYFFDPDNLEMSLKILDGSQFNGELLGVLRLTHQPRLRADGERYGLRPSEDLQQPAGQLRQRRGHQRAASRDLLRRSSETAAPAALAESRRRNGHPFRRRSEIVAGRTAPADHAGEVTPSASCTPRSSENSWCGHKSFSLDAVYDLL